MGMRTNPVKARHSLGVFEHAPSLPERRYTGPLLCRLVTSTGTCPGLKVDDQGRATGDALVRVPGRRALARRGGRRIDQLRHGRDQQLGFEGFDDPALGARLARAPDQ